MATVSTTSNYWISPTALNIQLNALGDADYVQASIVSGAVIMCFIDGIIGYDTAHNYKRWPLSAYPTYFDTPDEKYVYARIPNEEVSDDTQALIVYSSVQIDLYGNKMPEQTDPAVGKIPEYFYIYLGHISAHTATPEGQTVRTWIEKLYDEGRLSSDQQNREELTAEWKKMFMLDSETNSIIAKLPFVSIVTRLLKLGPKEKEIVDVKRSVDSNLEVPVSDNTIPTTKQVADNYLSKKHDDRAKGKITFDKGVDFGDFVPGLVGQGGRIDKGGHGEMRSLRLWETLEVPEIRFNRVSVYVGIRMDTFAGGIVETVTPNPNMSGAGTLTLKLEEGEYGSAEEGDLMMGIWHDEKGGNATEAADDHQGNFAFAGFKTIYFLVTKVTGAHNEHIEYVLRGRDEGGNGFHPFPSMHFAGRGNIHNEKPLRQAFTYSTTLYSVSLKEVNTWVFEPRNFYELRGYIEGFKMWAENESGEMYLKEFHGHGQVFGNAYLYGNIEKFDRQGFYCDIVQSTNGFMTPADVDVVTVYVRDAYGEDITDRFFLKSLTRNSGDEATDADWNNQFQQKHPQEIPNPFELAWTDLGFDLSCPNRFKATFYLVAEERATGKTVPAFFDFS